MAKLLRRWYVWLGLVLLLGLAGSVVVILVSPSQITQANFDRIQEGMNKAEVTALLGAVDGHLATHRRPVPGVIPVAGGFWRDGPNWLSVSFDNDDDTVSAKEIHLATAWETLQWYAKKGAEKLGILKRVGNPFDDVWD
jgi:hypothetical protein